MVYRQQQIASDQLPSKYIATTEPDSYQHAVFGDPDDQTLHSQQSDQNVSRETHYNGDINTPYYKVSSNVPFTTLDIVKMLLLKEISPHSVCSKIPQNVWENAEFLISKDALEDDRDIFCDGYGHWIRSGIWDEKQFTIWEER